MKKTVLKYRMILLLTVGISAVGTAAENFYCKYCGICRSSVQGLTAARCPRHPAGPNKGWHALYQGSEKKQYTCMYCGIKRNSISSLTSGMCSRHPDGPGKGRHAPAL